MNGDSPTTIVGIGPSANFPSVFPTSPVGPSSWLMTSAAPTEPLSSASLPSPNSAANPSTPTSKTKLSKRCSSSTCSERIFRHIFDNPEFTRRNVIAAEIEKVIDSLTKRHFSRDEFLHDLDPFYKAIEEAAASTETYTEKQAFLNKVYTHFFQGINRKLADTHGIVYTPQPIVDFMVRSVEEILKSEFGRSLGDKDVHVLDPFAGTGTFITGVMQQIKTSRLAHKYNGELHCNEIMLLPYYIATMNIEHEYIERTGEYEAFEGICLVDTFDIKPQMLMFSEQNLKRIQRQRSQPIL
jgi:predicted helicase